MALIDVTRHSRVAYYKELVDENLWPLGKFNYLSQTLQSEVEGGLMLPEDKIEVVRHWTDRYLSTPVDPDRS